MTDACRIDLGPATEARFQEAFAHKAVLTCSQAADLIGVDEKTMPSLPIRSVPKGAKHRGYTERDLRLYLTEESAAECAPTPKPKRESGPRRPGANVRVVNFSERRQAR